MENKEDFLNKLSEEPKTLEEGSPKWLEWKEEQKIIKEKWSNFFPEYKEKLDRFQKKRADSLINGPKTPRN